MLPQFPRNPRPHHLIVSNLGVLSHELCYFVYLRLLTPGLTTAILCLFATTLPAQNLLLNPSFEILRSSDPIVEGSPGNFTHKVPGWQLIAGSHHVCTTSYTGSAVDTSSFSCADGKVAPFAGRAMFELEYVAQCTSPAMTKQGCSGYLQQTLGEPLAIGKVYELSMQVYVQSTSNPGYANHIGFQAYTKRLPVRANYLLDGREFLLDTVIFDQWYRAKWTIRPVCELKSIVFGVFRNEDGPPVHNRNVWEDMFFLDDLRLTEVGYDAAVEVPPYCKTAPVTDRPHALPGLSVYFDVNDATVRTAARPALDSFARQLRRYPKTVFEICGYTDPTGTNHRELAGRRIDSTLAYLQREHRINPLRFVKIPAGADSLTDGVGGEDNLQLARRVTITESEAWPQDVLYRHLLLAINAGNFTDARRWFPAWLRLATDRQVGFAGYDPRLESLLRQAGMKRLFRSRAKEIYTPADRESGRVLLDSLWYEDQLPCTLGRYLENLFYYVEAIDTAANFWRVDLPSFTAAELQGRDSSHAVRVTDWLANNDWPTISEVGARAAKAVPLVLIHGGDTAAVRQYLPAFERRCRAGEGEWRYYAMLYDRNRVRRGLPQTFGTQFREGERLPVADWAEMNRLRRAYGLPVINM